MSEQVVLITGALTGIGRATAIAFAREGAKIVVSGRHDKEDRSLSSSFELSVLKRSLCGRMCAKKEMSKNLLTTPSLASAAWTWQSITLAPKANRDHLRTRRQRPMQQHLTRMCLARC